MVYYPKFLLSDTDTVFLSEISDWLVSNRKLSSSTVKSDTDWVCFVIRNNIKETDDFSIFTRSKKSKIRRALREIEEFRKFKEEEKLIS